jgi:CRISPR-associated protein Cas1
MLPAYTYFKSTDVLTEQLNASNTLKDRVWQKIIKNKIKNQSQVLAKLNKPSSLQLENLLGDVLVGDKNNVEAIASRIYFIALFDKNFNRRDDNLVNTCLNYGYAIIRSSIAKSLASKGFNCTLGIHHRSVLNNFNLADDLIEPFRAIVDYKVSNMDLSSGVFDKNHKESLVKIMESIVHCEKGKVRLNTACDMLVDSLIKVYRNKDASLLLEIEI